MKILFTFENLLPSREADAEVFLTTARYLARHLSCTWMHVPARRGKNATLRDLAGMPVIRAIAPLKPAALRHFVCGLTLPLHRAFWQADAIYTRNLWIAWVALRFHRRVVFDHYRPWPDQIPPLQHFLFRLMSSPRFIINISHSDYTKEKYASLGVPAHKLVCIRNGFEPDRLASPISVGEAKQRLGIPDDRMTVAYTGRINHKKGLPLVIEAARRLPDILFLLVGSSGKGPIEDMARDIPNVLIVPWQTPQTLSRYIYAADILLIPPSLQPLARFGSTVLPLKLFLYLASGRPILAGDTPDVGEVLRDGDNALLCRPDDPEALVARIRTLADDFALRERLAMQAQKDSRNLTWDARAERIIVALITSMTGQARPQSQWSAAQSARWRRQSWLWFLRFLRHGDLILPPAVGAASYVTLPRKRRVVS